MKWEKGHKPWNTGKKRPPFSNQWKNNMAKATKKMWENGVYSKRGKQWKENLSKATKGRIPWNKGKKWTKETLEKLKGPRDNIVGENNPNWRGGIDQIIRGIRRSREYLRFKKFIRERDKNCVFCGSFERLHVDHVKSFTYFPKLRYEPKNARLLCFECHKMTPNFGSKAIKGVVQGI